MTPVIPSIRKEEGDDVNSTETSNNNTKVDNKNTDSSLRILLLLMDRSQLVMAICGLLANMATALTLIKNGQVCMGIVAL